MHEIDADDEALRQYMKDIASSAPLSRQREVELASRIEKGDMAARDALAHANLRFVIEVAKTYRNRGLSFAELISAGNVGLMTAAERFDGTRGYKFISYAVWWIRQAIRQALAEQIRTVRLPVNRQSLLQQISLASKRLEHNLEVCPSMDEIATEMDLSAKEVAETLGSGAAIQSLDQTFAEDDDRSLMATLADPDQLPPDLGVLCDSVNECVEVILRYLHKRERRIIRLYYGLDGRGAFTLEQIGAELGITRETSATGEGTSSHQAPKSVGLPRR